MKVKITQGENGVNRYYLKKDDNTYIYNSLPSYDFTDGKYISDTEVPFEQILESFTNDKQHFLDELLLRIHNNSKGNNKVKDNAENKNAERQNAERQKEALKTIAKGQNLTKTSRIIQLVKNVKKAMFREKDDDKNYGDK